MVGRDFECQIEGLARSDDTKILIENNEGFSDRVHDSMCKFPGVLDVGELFSKHAATLAGRESTELSVPVRSTCAEDISPYALHLRSATQIDAWAQGSADCACTNPAAGHWLLFRSEENQDRTEI
jgi:hypothetical protein